MNQRVCLTHTTLNGGAVNEFQWCQKDIYLAWRKSPVFLVFP